MEQPIIDKILKLQAKADGTDNQAEAQAFAAKAQQLLIEHNLSVEVIEARKSEKSAKYIQGDSHKMNRYFGFSWQHTLAFVIASSTFTKAFERVRQDILTSKITYSIAFAGRPDNVKVASYLYVTLQDQVFNMTLEYANSKFNSIPNANRKLKRKFVTEVGKGYLLGLLSGLKDRLDVQYKEALSSHGESLVALVRQEKKAIEDFLNLSPAAQGRSTLQQNNHSKNGLADAEKIPLTQGLESAEAPTQKFLQ